MKRSRDHLDEGDRSLPITVKVLLPFYEAAVVQGGSGTPLRTMEEQSGATFTLSRETDVYPGTDMRELRISGPCADAVLKAVAAIFSKVSGTCGAVTGGEAGVEAGDARVKVALPAQATSSFDSARGGGGLDQLREAGVQGRLVSTLIPFGEATNLSEQVLCLSTTLTGVQPAFRIVVEVMERVARNSWFGAWAASSHCGPKMLGLNLFSEGAAVPAASSGTGSGRGRRSRWDEGAGHTTAASASPAGGCAVSVGQHGGNVLVLKVLLSIDEAASLRGPGSVIFKEIRQKIGSEVWLSQEGQLYPGTSLHEMKVMGPSAEANVAATMEVFSKIVETKGLLCCGDSFFEPGGARMRLVIPARSTAAVIGPGGKIVGQIRSETKLHVHIETAVVPPGSLLEITEQVVSFDGPLGGIQPALMHMARILSQFQAEAWFARWAAHSNSGVIIPGLILFQDGKGKGGKCKMKGKERGGLTMKLLLPPNETSCVLGKGGSTVREIGQATGTRVATSGRFEFFPGTQLQELKIQGATTESVLNALVQILAKIAELTGAVCGGQSSVEPGGARIKVVVPCRAAQAIVGSNGAMLRMLREQSGMMVRVEETIVPLGAPIGAFSEQVVAISGPMDGAYMALKAVAEAVGQFVGAGWYESWAANSNCSETPMDLSLFGDWRYKGKGRGKGAPKGKGLSLEEGWLMQGSFVDAAGSAFGQESFGYFDPDMNGEGYGADGGCGGASETASCGAGVTDCTQDMHDFRSPSGNQMALKVLISAEEVAVLGEDPTTMALIQQATETTGLLSETRYPGTPLQELVVQGPTVEAVFNATLLIITRLGEVMGSVSSGERSVPWGEARVKLVVPTPAASAIIGPGGQTMKQIKAQTGVSVCVDMNSIPCGDGLMEQAVRLAGPLAGIQPSLGQVVTEVASFWHEPWFETWAAHSNAGVVVPGLLLFDFGSGKGF